MRWSSFVRSLDVCTAGTTGCGVVPNEQRVRLHSLLAVWVSARSCNITLMRYFTVQIHYNQWRWRLRVDLRWLVCWMYGTGIVLARPKRAARTFAFIAVWVSARSCNLALVMHCFAVQIHYNQWRWRLFVDLRWLTCWMYGTGIVLARPTWTGRTFALIAACVSECSKL